MRVGTWVGRMAGVTQSLHRETMHSFIELGGEEVSYYDTK